MKKQNRPEPEKIYRKKTAVSVEDTASLDMCIQENHAVVYIRKTSEDISDLLEGAKEIETITFNKSAGLMLLILKFEIEDISQQVLDRRLDENPREDVHKYNYLLSQKDDVYEYMRSAWKSARR